jgi:hypothetical protein
MPVLFDHDWTSAPDSAAGAAGSTSGAGQDGGYTDRVGGQASVASGRLVLAGTGGYGGLVYRPASEAAAHGRVTATLAPLGGVGQFWACPRVTDGAAGDFVALRVALSAAVLVADRLFAFVGGGPGPFADVNLGAPAGTLAGDTVTIAVEARASVGGSTDYAVTITNLTRGGSTAATVADATAALQGAGAAGLLSEGGSGPVSLARLKFESIPAVVEPARHRMRLRAGSGGGVAILT